MNSTLLSLMAADASGSANSTASMMTTIITFALIILIFYFLIIRPQKKKDKEKDKGEAVLENGGEAGSIQAHAESAPEAEAKEESKDNGEN